MGLSTAISNCIVSDISVDCVSEGRLLAKVVPTSKRNGYPLISTFHQPEFEAVLLDGLQRFPCVNLRFQHSVETLEQNADCVVVTIRTPAGTLHKVRCSYLLACDGGGSTIRHSLNIPLQGKTFAQRWLVIDSISKCTGTLCRSHITLCGESCLGDKSFRKSSKFSAIHNVQPCLSLLLIMAGMGIHAPPRPDGKKRKC